MPDLRDEELVQLRAWTHANRTSYSGPRVATLIDEIIRRRKLTKEKLEDALVSPFQESLMRRDTWPATTDDVAWMAATLARIASQVMANLTTGES